VRPAAPGRLAAAGAAPAAWQRRLRDCVHRRISQLRSSLLTWLSDTSGDGEGRAPAAGDEGVAEAPSAMRRGAARIAAQPRGAWSIEVAGHAPSPAPRAKRASRAPAAAVGVEMDTRLEPAGQRGGGTAAPAAGAGGLPLPARAGAAAGRSAVRGRPACPPRRPVGPPAAGTAAERLLLAQYRAALHGERRREASSALDPAVFGARLGAASTVAEPAPPASSVGERQSPGSRSAPARASLEADASISGATGGRADDPGALAAGPRPGAAPGGGPAVSPGDAPTAGGGQSPGPDSAGSPGAALAGGGRLSIFAWPGGGPARQPGATPAPGGGSDASSHVSVDDTYSPVSVLAGHDARQPQLAPDVQAAVAQKPPAAAEAAL